MKNRIGFTFPWIIVLMGFTIIFISIPIMIVNPIVGIILLFIGSFFGLSSYGSEIDLEGRKYREYGSMFGIRRGQWEDLNLMPFLGVFKSKTGYLVYSRASNSTTEIEDKYDVCLMNASHRKRILLQKFKNINDALDFAHSLEKIIDVKLTVFNPRNTKA